MLNELLVKQGLAVPLTIPPNIKHEYLFRKALKYAKANKKGFWEKGGLAMSPYEYRKIKKYKKQ